MIRRHLRHFYYSSCEQSQTHSSLLAQIMTLSKRRVGHIFAFIESEKYEHLTRADIERFMTFYWYAFEDV